jgi:hypothetical protein
MSYRVVVPKTINALRNANFLMPRPRHRPEQLLALNDLKDFSYLGPNVPGVSDAGYKVLGKLYFKGSSATIKELGTHARAVDPLKKASLVYEKRKNILTLSPKGYRVYELIYFHRLERYQRQRLKEQGIPINLNEDY